MDWKALIAKYLPQLIELLVKQFAKSSPMAASIDAKLQSKVLKLSRKQFRHDGIFSELSDESGKIMAYTLEHSYDNLPKLPNGTFQCVLGTHQLDHGGPKQLYCVQNVPGHDGICFHIGNSNKDSDGCILLGQQITSINGAQVITLSERTFDSFMASMAAYNEFTLVIE